MHEFHSITPDMLDATIAYNNNLPFNWEINPGDIFQRKVTHRFNREYTDLEKK